MCNDYAKAMDLLPSLSTSTKEIAKKKVTLFPPRTAQFLDIKQLVMFAQTMSVYRILKHGSIRTLDHLLQNYK